MSINPARPGGCGPYLRNRGKHGDRMCMIRPVQGLLLLIVIVLMAGCLKVGPDFTPPAANVADKWQDFGDPRVKAESLEHRDWWQAFGDPEMNRVIDTAYRQNLTLRQAGVRVLEARAQLGVAIGEWFPQTQQAIGSYQKYRYSERGALAGTGRGFHYYQADLGWTAAWELDFWGKFRRNIESADASLAATIADYDSTLVSLTGDAAANYIAIRTLEKRLVIGRQNVAIQQENLQLATAKFMGGTTTQRDVEQAKTLLLNTQAGIETLEIQLRQSKNALSVLLGLTPNHVTDVLKGPGDIPVPPPRVAVGIPADLLRRRPDIRSAEAQAAAQCAQIGVAKADLYPAFSIGGTFTFQAADIAKFNLGQMFQWRSRDAQAGPSFQWNILNYGRIRSQVRVQDARFQQLIISYQNTVLRAQREVEDALIGFLRSQARARHLADSTGAARRSLHLATRQYQEGITDFTTVITAEQALLSEQDSLASTLGDIASYLVGVYRSLGGGWQLREGHGFVPAEVKAEMAKRTNWGKLLAPEPRNTLGENLFGAGKELAPASPVSATTAPK